MYYAVNSMKAQLLKESACFQCFANYFKQNPDVRNNCVCMKCDTKNSLWFCLECAHIGCGRSDNAHARAHYQATKHFYVMNLETFQIWDYKKSEYVQHNLNEVKTPEKPRPHKISTDNAGADAHSHCPCPACVYAQMPKFSKESACMRCGAKEKLFLCLTCGHLGCGRNSECHAKKHYDKTQHPQVMNMKIFTIWDYKDEKYIHRCLNDITSNVQVKAKIKKEEKSEHFQAFNERMQRLENEWGNFCKQMETNPQMTSIEQKLITLCEGSHIMEQKLSEQDNKLNDLLNNIHTRNEDSLCTPTKPEQDSGIDHSYNGDSQSTPTNEEKDRKFDPSSYFKGNNQDFLSPPTKKEPDSKFDPSSYFKGKNQNFRSPPTKQEPDSKFDPSNYFKGNNQDFLSPPTKQEPDSKFDPSSYFKGKNQNFRSPPTKQEPDSKFDPSSYFKGKNQNFLSPPTKQEPDSKYDPTNDFKFKNQDFLYPKKEDFPYTPQVDPGDERDRNNSGGVTNINIKIFTSPNPKREMHSP